MARTTVGALDVRSTAALSITSITAKKHIGTIQLVAYSASITPDLSLGDILVLTVTNTSVFTINAPLNPTIGQRWILRLANASGGTMGVITWDATFRQGTVNRPVNGKSAVLEFYWDGTNHWKVSEADAL